MIYISSYQVYMILTLEQCRLLIGIFHCILLVFLIGCSLVGVYINKMKTTFLNILYLNRFPFTPTFNIYSFHFCHGKRGVLLLKEGGANGEDYLYDHIPKCRRSRINIYVEHRSKMYVAFLQSHI